MGGGARVIERNLERSPWLAYGSITHTMLALGAGRGAIAGGRERGLLQHMHVGVYRWGPIETPRTRTGRVVACDQEAPASHHAALALYGIRPLPRGTIDVTTVARHAAPRGVPAHDPVAASGRNGGCCTASR